MVASCPVMEALPSLSKFPPHAGLRVKGQGSQGSFRLPRHVPYLDHMLVEREAVWPAIRPDVVLQLGGRVVSKRIGQFLEWSVLDRWVDCSVKTGCVH